MYSRGDVITGISIRIKYFWGEGGGGLTAVAQWLRCCANVAGSIPAGVIGIFH